MRLTFMRCTHSPCARMPAAPQAPNESVPFALRKIRSLRSRAVPALPACTVCWCHASQRAVCAAACVLMQAQQHGGLKPAPCVVHAMRLDAGRRRRGSVDGCVTQRELQCASPANSPLRAGTLQEPNGCRMSYSYPSFSRLELPAELKCVCVCQRYLRFSRVRQRGWPVRVVRIP